MPDETKLDKPIAPLTLGSKKSLHQRVADAGVAKQASAGVGFSLPQGVPRFINFQRIMLLPDASGSMDASVCDEHGREVGTRIDLLKQAVDTYLQNCFASINYVGVASFPEGAYASPSGDHTGVKNLIKELVAGGGTPMAAALGYISDNEQFTHAVLISDGSPDDREGVLAEARAYASKNITVDCVHIGDEEQGAALLKQVAEITGGTYVKFTNVQNFAKTFAFLAPAKRAQLTTSRNPVALLGAADVKL